MDLKKGFVSRPSHGSAVATVRSATTMFTRLTQAKGTAGALNVSLEQFEALLVPG